MLATIENRHDDDSPMTFRDENGGLWRVFVDAADGTLAVEEIEDYGGGSSIPAIDDRATIGERPCGIARWTDGVDRVEISRCSSHGENHTAPATYGVNCAEEFLATSAGWRPVNGE